jgi:hypothetical protein
MHFFFINSRYYICIFFSGIRHNKEGFPLEEENFDEAVKSVNTALVPNSVCCIVFVLSRTL